MDTEKNARKTRLAIIVSHPIQYYVPLYRRLAARPDLEITVFFTWHAGTEAQHDPGFKRNVAWDIPLTEGYDHELVENVASERGSDHFWGIRTPALVKRVLQWKPDVVQITGYAYASHLRAIRAFHKNGVPVLFRGDSHLLDARAGCRWQVKRLLLNRLYSWVRGCLYVGKNNYDYYRAVGVPRIRLHHCPHSVEVQRFAEPNDEFEIQARSWRAELTIPETSKVLVFAGKFEPRKRPLELMHSVSKIGGVNIVLIMVGNGVLENEVQDFAARWPDRFRILPFQNQSRMPLVYRLGDIFTLPSAYGETWGLAVNEALASGRRVLISDRVGCAPDLVRSPLEGKVFGTDDWNDFENKLRELFALRSDSGQLRRHAKVFDIPATEFALVAALKRITKNE